MTAVAEKHEPARWLVETKVSKFNGDWTAEEIDAGLAGDPYEEIVVDGNLLTIGGASALWERLMGASGVAAFDNPNSNLGVGDSNAAAADTQTDLQAGANKLRKVMDATYPQHTDSTGTAGSKTITYRATFLAGDANFAWQEWGLFNAAVGGRMLNRRVESLGTKTSSATWQLTITITLA